MNTAHWHLLLNHLPVTGIVISTLVLVGGYVLKNVTVRNTALGLFVFTALAAIPAYLTGEGAEEIAEKLPGVTENAIEKHEDIGKIFLISTMITGVLAVLAWFLRSRRMAFMYVLVLLSGLATSYVAKEAGTSGGVVRHTEIRTGQGSATDAAQPAETQQGDDD